ncbi:DUF1905 domain-containing protein [Flavobacterium sp.]|uniref:DUF1905 domain-containing protein n=1 Tax=Flavobacterium sp. TaxID=239 RepID=UPI002FDD8DA5
MKFQGKIYSFGENSLGHGPYIEIPEAIYQELLKITTDKRVKCTLNNKITVSRAMAPKGDFHYILLNKEVLKEAKLSLGDSVLVELQPDESKYGMPISEEMEEVLYHDPDGSVLFHKLTPGAQRTLIHIINKIKSTNLKIERSFVILEHLKKTKGKIDFELLKEDFKNQRNNMKF